MSAASPPSSILKTVLPQDVVSIMEFRELATAARESAREITAAVHDASHVMSGGMRGAGEDVAGSMWRAGAWVGMGLCAVAGAWAFSSYLDYLKHTQTQKVHKRRKSSVSEAVTKAPDAAVEGRQDQA